MERIVEKYQLNNIHEMWPNFELYVYGGVYIEPYLKRFEKLCGKKVHTLNTYLSSEGYFAYQNRPDTHTMQLLLNTGIFMNLFRLTPIILMKTETFISMRKL